jgi:hypothetical protein
MRMDLGASELRHLLVDLGAEGGSKRRIVVEDAQALSGHLSRDAESLRLSDVKAREIRVEALHLDYPSVSIQADTGGRFETPKFRMEHQPGRLDLELEVARLEVPEIAVKVADLALRGPATLIAGKLAIHGGDGKVDAHRAELGPVRVVGAPIEIDLASAVGDGLQVAWGRGGLRVGLRTLRVPELRLAFGPATLALRGIVLDDARLEGGALSVGRMRVEGAEVTTTLSPPAEEEPTLPSEKPAIPYVDLSMLDGLSGDLNVNVAVDLTVPIIGRRRATHRFRIPIEDGSVDFMGLEGDLSTLESTLLDFALRDDQTLVLEQGIPLLPTRGRGKPILAWPLGPQDLELARRSRVRLAILHRAELVGRSTDPPPPSSERERPPAVALRSLGVKDLDLRARLAKPKAELAAPLRTLAFELLSVQGNVFHDPDGEARPGTVAARVEALDLGVQGLAIAGRRIDLRALSLENLSAGRVDFVGIQPRHAEATLTGLEVTGLSVRPIAK